MIVKDFVADGLRSESVDILPGYQPRSDGAESNPDNVVTSSKRDYNLVSNDLYTSDDPRHYVLQVRDMEDEDRPREKLQRLGAQELTMAELVAVIWGVGTRKEDVMTMAQRTLHEYGSRAIVHETRPDRLVEVLDIPFAKACQIVASIELGRRFFASRQGKPVFVRTAAQAFEHLRTLGVCQKEELRGLYLNSRFELMHEEVISVGSATSSIVHPREVFRPAVEHGAVAVLLAHNHPSGSLEPTAADVRVTSQIKAAGEMIGIELLDHIIIAGSTYISMISGERDV